MIRKIGDIITLDFITFNPTTGAISNADDTITCEIFENDSDTPILTPSVIQRTDRTGNYRITFEASILNGFSSNNDYNIIASGSVNSIAQKQIIGNFKLESNNITDCYNLLSSQAGSNLIDITVISVDNTLPIDTVHTYIYTSQQQLVTFGLTDQSGIYSALLNTGLYNVYCYKIGFGFDNPFQLDVTNDSTIQIDGTGVVISSPTPSETCRVYEFCFRPDGVTPASSITATATIISLPPDATGIIYETISGIYNPINGEVYQDIIHGAKVQFSIKELRLSIVKTIPALSGIRLSHI